MNRNDQTHSRPNIFTYEGKSIGENFIILTDQLNKK